MPVERHIDLIDRAAEIAGDFHHALVNELVVIHGASLTSLADNVLRLAISLISCRQPSGAGCGGKENR